MRSSRYLVRSNRLRDIVLFLTISMMFAILDLPAQSAKEESTNSLRDYSLDAKMLELYAQANKLYNAGEYQQAIDISERIVAIYDKSMITRFPDESLPELAHFLISNCYVGMKNLCLAETELRKVISSAKKEYFSVNAAARAQLKIASIYHNANEYLKALKGYQAAVDDYPGTGYAEYVQEKIEEIERQKVGELEGKAYLGDEDQHEGITITIFNGFSSNSIPTKADGSYSIPFFRSTEGTYISVFASRKGYLPEVRNISVKGEKTHQVDEMTLSPMEDPGLGVITGVCFKAVQGGKLRPHYGISSYDADLGIEIKGKQKKYTVKSTQQGFYLLALPAGNYRLVTDRGYVVEGVTVKGGEAKICNLSSGRIMVD